MGILDKIKNAFKFLGEKEKLAPELKSEEALQKLVNKLAFQLADWWGIPRDKIAGKIPRLIFGIGYNEGYFPSGNEIILSKEFIQEITSEKSKKKFYRFSLESVLGEEVGHFLDYTIKSQLGIKCDESLTEFFGLTSNLHVAYEQNPEFFKVVYREGLRDAIQLREEEKRIKDRLDDMKNKSEPLERKLCQKLGIQSTKELIKKLMKFDAEDIAILKELNKINKDYWNLAYQQKYLPYKHACAYYFEIRKMTKEERYNLLKMSPQEFEEAFIKGKALRKVDEIKKNIEERNLIKNAVRELNKNYPETGQFFERSEEAREETEVQESVECSTEEYSETEQYPQEQPQEEIQLEQKKSPKVIIEIPEKLSKKEAKKFGSVEIDIPKRLSKKLKK
jgi:hypothetical protein